MKNIAKLFNELLVQSETNFKGNVGPL